MMTRLSGRQVGSKPDSLNGFRRDELGWKAFTLIPEDPFQLIQRERYSHLVQKCEQAVGCFAGKSVLELGPQEGSITTAVHQAYVQEIVAIEQQWSNYLKCLIVKEHFRLANARFFLGDPMAYLETCETRFDIAIATGILFRSPNPCRVLELLTRTADTIAISTNVFDPTDGIHGFTGEQKPVDSAHKGLYVLHERQWGTRKNGSASNDKSGRKAWTFAPDDLIGYIEELGYTSDVFMNVQSGNSGRRLGLIAQKNV